MNVIPADTLALPGYTAPEVEALLGLPEKCVYRLIREGRLSAYRDINGRLRIQYAELYRYLKTLETTGV